tara:strand:- start:52 stop:585 length:534 start_codon:yes stop_codon:yes gene_type:complete
MIEIKTTRLVLRHIEPTYKQSLIDLLGDESVASMMSNVPFPYKETDADWWIGAVKTKPYALNIFSKDELIGGVALTEQDTKIFELGYWIGKLYWGNGYATEACLGILKYIRNIESDAQVFAKVYPNNMVSKKILVKLGFIEDGTDVSIDISSKEQILCERYALKLSQLHLFKTLEQN